MKMSVQYRITSEEIETIRAEMKKTKKKSVYRKLEVVALLGEGKNPQEVAEITKYSEQHVRRLGVEYNRTGLASYATDGRKGGNHRLMKPEEEKAFLKRFEEEAESGKTLTVEGIAQALDGATGKSRKSLSTAYSFLHHNGWRKVMPRPKHPKKASDEEIDSSKKLTLASKN